MADTMKRNEFIRAIASVLENDGFVAQANDEVWRNAEYATAELIRSAKRLPSAAEIANEIRPYIRANIRVAEKQVTDRDGNVIAVVMSPEEADKALELGLAHEDTLGGLRAFTMIDGVKTLVEARITEEDETDKVAHSLHRVIVAAADDIAMLADGELDESVFIDEEIEDEAPTKLICDLCESGDIQRVVEASYEYDACTNCGEYYPLY